MIFCKRVNSIHKLNGIPYINLGFAKLGFLNFINEKIMHEFTSRLKWETNQNDNKIRKTNERV